MKPSALFKRPQMASPKSCSKTESAGESAVERIMGVRSESGGQIMRMSGEKSLCYEWDSQQGWVKNRAWKAWHIESITFSGYTEIHILNTHKSTYECKRQIYTGMYNTYVCKCKGTCEMYIVMYI